MFPKKEISVGRNHTYRRTVIIWRVSQNANIQFNSIQFNSCLLTYWSQQTDGQ